MAFRPPAPHVTRRSLFWLFVLLVIMLSGCGASPGDTGDGEQALAGDVRLRLMAANLTSGSNQSYDLGHGIRVLQGARPDVVMIQEFNYKTNSAADIRAFVDTAFGTGFSYYREGGAQIPNGIISRYPIVASGEWDDTSVSNRDFAWARIDIPGPVDLWAISVHLLGSSSTARNTEAKQLVSFIRANVPSSAYLVIGGDLNTGSRTEAAITTLSQVAVTTGPFPADRNGNTNTNASRGSPYDWLLADSDLSALKTPVVLGGSTFANGLVTDTRVYSPISELSPALSTDSGATGMQHMGVVRDFLVPGGAPAGVATVFLNEILANEPGSNTAGELVELVNSGTASLDLSGFTLSDSVSIRHTFAAGTTLAAGRALVVFGGASAIPAGLTNALACSTGTLGLSNSGDTVTLKNAAGVTVDSFTYTSTLASADGVSMNRSPDGSSTGAFVLHSSLGASSSSPGVRVSGAAF